MGGRAIEAARDIGIGSRVRAARDRLALSREALAFHSGISWSAIAQVESGRRTNLRPSTLAAHARALGVTIDYLVEGCATSTAMVEHRALLYETEEEFSTSAVPFLAEAVERSEAALAVTSEANIAQLRRELGADADQVRFAEHLDWYNTPTTALTGYRAFLDQSVCGGSTWVRILGEPVWSFRSDSATRLWARYEALLNLVFSSAPVSVLCCYDVRQTNPGVIEHARAAHPETLERGRLQPSSDYVDPAGFVLSP